MDNDSWTVSSKRPKIKSVTKRNAQNLNDYNDPEFSLAVNVTSDKLSDTLSITLHFPHIILLTSMVRQDSSNKTTFRVASEEAVLSGRILSGRFLSKNPKNRIFDRFLAVSNRKEVHLLDLRKFLPFSMLLFSPEKCLIALDDSPKSSSIVEKKMILRAGVKNIREIQRFRPKRFINSEANPQVTHWETARALTLTERLEGMCSIYNFPKIRPFLTK